MTLTARNLSDLPAVAEAIIPQIEHNIIQFVGEMGAGKTTLIKEMLKQFGTEDRVSSPTYSLVNEYLTSLGIVYHFDFYRIKDESEAYDMGWEEYAESGNLCLIEWPEKIASLIPEKSHILEISNHDGVRTITFN